MYNVHIHVFYNLVFDGMELFSGNIIHKTVVKINIPVVYH